MTIDQLNDKLTNALINFLNKRDHNNTGTLEKSIGFSSVVGNDGDLELILDAKEYIQYLDDGEFLDDFFSTKEFENIINQWYTDNLI